jgi:hypothetical protein
MNPTCIDSSMTHGWQAGFGMPSSARDRVARLRDLLPVPAGVDIVAAWDTSALSQDVDIDRSAVTVAVVTDAAVKGAFPGTPAWSPPI